MNHRKLVHNNPRLNDPHMWYRLVYAPDNALHYFAIIVGKEGVVNGTLHAVPKSDFTVAVEVEKITASVPEAKEEADEFV